MDTGDVDKLVNLALLDTDAGRRNTNISTSKLHRLYEIDERTPRLSTDSRLCLQKSHSHFQKHEES